MLNIEIDKILFKYLKTDLFLQFQAIDEATFSKFYKRARKLETDLSGLESRVTTTENKVSDGINIRKTTEWPGNLFVFW